MNQKKQREVFLESEGDEWYRRNYQIQDESKQISTYQDELTDMIRGLEMPNGAKTKVLEIGCGQGLRLEKLREERGWDVLGIDPSKNAIKEMRSRNLNGYVGTADKLPIKDNSIDLLIFGFCLYLCDRDDLFTIGAEAHRVLKQNSWMAILDFWSANPRKNAYHHKEGIQTYKDDIPKMFIWHPSYVITDHKVRHHRTRKHTDDADEWIAATIIRRSDQV